MHKIILFLSCLLSFNLYASEKLIWLSDTAGLFENYTNDQDISISTNTTRMMLRQLTDVEFELQVSSLSRIERQLKSKTSICMSGRIKNPQRMLTSYFSQPIHLYPSMRLYYRKKNHPLPSQLMDENGYLTSLSELFQHKKEYSLLLVPDRSYGQFLDKELKKIPKQNISYRSGLNQYNAIADMLLKGRIDFTLAYPTWFSNNIEHDSAGLSLIHSVLIEKEQSFILGRVQCTKTPLGFKVINQINKILDKLYLTPKFYEEHTKFIIKNDHHDFKKNYTTVFIDRNF